MIDLPKHKSSRANHPDVAPVLAKFVARLPGHVAKLRQSLAANDRAELQRLTHQLRGNGKSFGFEQMSQLAAEAEDLLIAGKPLADVAPVVERLTEFMMNVEGYAG